LWSARANEVKRLDVNFNQFNATNLSSSPDLVEMAMKRTGDQKERGLI
jgi:hypothetical protein